MEIMVKVMPTPTFYKNKTVLVTGHTGFKGSWLSLWLHSMGAQVIGYALEPNTTPNLFNLLKLSDKIIHISGDIRDYDKLAGVIRTHKPDIVFHLAAQALVLPSYTNPRYTYETNVMGTVNLLEAIRHSGSVKVCVNVTSDKCYENKEWIYPYRENEPMGGYDPYSSSKGCAELVSSAYRLSFLNNEGIAMATARAGNVIGGGDWSENRLIPDCIKSFLDKKQILIRNPNSIRPWQHVLEPLSGYMLLAEKLYEDSLKYSSAWNFGPNDTDAKPVKWIVEKMCQKWGNNSSYQIENNEYPHEAHYLKLDCSKVKTELGWYPKWSLEQSLDKIIEWTIAYKNQENMENTSLKQINDYINTQVKN